MYLRIENIMLYKVLVENDEQIVVINIMLNFDGKFNREFRLRIEKMNKKKTNKKKTN